MKISWDSCDEGSDLETTRKSIEDAIRHVVNEENSSKIGVRGSDRGFDLEKVDFAKVGFQNDVHNLAQRRHIRSIILKTFIREAAFQESVYDFIDSKIIISYTVLK